MFFGCSSLNSPIILTEFFNVTSAYSMFNGCTLFNQDITLNCEKLTNASYMFQGCHALNSPITLTNCGVLTNVNYMFNGCYAFNQVIDFTDDLGFYRPSQIASTLQAKCIAFVPGMLVEYSPVAVFGNDGLPLCFYAYDSTGTDLFSFSPMPINTSAYPFNEHTIQLFDILGFNSTVQILGTAHFGGQTLCQDVRSVDIVCSLLTYNQSLKDTSSQPTVRDSLCRLYLADGGTQNTGIIEPNDPLFCPPGCAPTTIYRNFNTPKQIQWIPNQPISSGLRFQLFDDNGNPLTDIGEDPGVINWSMSLLVTEN
jgi:hypothetical protein